MHVAQGTPASKPVVSGSPTVSLAQRLASPCVTRSGRWTLACRLAGAQCIASGALGEGAGFATGSKALVISSFVFLLAGLLQAVRTLATSPGLRPATAAAKAAAVS